MIYTFWILTISLLINGCSNNNSPVEFAKVEQTQKSGATIILPQDNVPKKESYTLLELFLEEKIERGYLMAWFFNDVTLYRAKLYYIRNEIKSKLPLSTHDKNRILFLEAGMNNAIRIFNDKNFLSRSREVVDAAIRSIDYFPIDKVKSSYTLEEIEQGGLPAAAISNNFWGFIGSLNKYGFKIETVNFLDR